MWQISADEPFATPKWKHQPPSAIYKLRQDCDPPKHVLFMAIRLNLVNFGNGGKLYRVFPRIFSLYACFWNVSVLEKIPLPITFFPITLKYAS
jgi:hypothetical protein